MLAFALLLILHYPYSQFVLSDSVIWAELVSHRFYSLGVMDGAPASFAAEGTNTTSLSGPASFAAEGARPDNEVHPVGADQFLLVSGICEPTISPDVVVCDMVVEAGQGSDEQQQATDAVATAEGVFETAEEEDARLLMEAQAFIGNMELELEHGPTTAGDAAEARAAGEFEKVANDTGPDSAEDNLRIPKEAEDYVKGLNTEETDPGSASSASGNLSAKQSMLTYKPPWLKPGFLGFATGNTGLFPLPEISWAALPSVDVPPPVQDNVTPVEHEVRITAASIKKRRVTAAQDETTRREKVVKAWLAILMLDLNASATGGQIAEAGEDSAKN